MSAPKPTVLFVHGSWHSPKHFGPVIKVFQAAGYETECPAQPSTGNLTLTDPLADDVKTIYDAAAALVEKARDVIVVMHSYGGIVGTQAITKDITKQARQSKGLSGGVIHLVYLAAFVVPVGASLGSALGGQLPPYISVQADGSCLMDNPETRFYNDIPDTEKEQWIEILQPQLAKAQLTPITNAAYQHCPVAYLYCENDQALPYQAQKMMVETFGNGFGTETCSSGHSPFLSQPETVLKIVQDIPVQ